ncbi:hypothetical protein EPUS_03743 [Endocarpon pusillum Z07020]|uniref:DlpA domain-containing protein n=1 Tax=Endocarpon pusillum (strain Z07020 / HMAS-L-300199) TaxID=1263415 RepID=U1HED8_ENDPU|nr:uncharacterized protein EPUS_03743 [Endocarpon pusillum Z07020]ERF68425.1 hypothetical protein EPUS_03743 [Endocarpon pusillum Z07020]
MEPSSPRGANHFSVLSSYSACDVSDALLKLQQPDSGEILHAGYLADIGELVLNRLFSQNVDCWISTICTLPTAFGLLNSITSPLPESGPNAIPKGQHWVDLTDEGTVMVIEQPEGQSCAAIGGIMALRMKTRGAMGCVVGGRVRDLEELNNCGLPVSAPGTINRIWKPKASAPVLVGHAPSMPSQVCLCNALYPVCFFLFDMLDISFCSPLYPLYLREPRGICIGITQQARKASVVSSPPVKVWACGKSTVGAGAESKVFARNIDVTIGGVKISPGDIIFCDPLEGVVAIPRNLLDKVISMVPKLVAADEKIKEDLHRGGSVARAFRTHRA